MHVRPRIARRALPFLIGVLGVWVAPAAAQVDLSGQWATRRGHENNGENQPVGDTPAATN